MSLDKKDLKLLYLLDVDARQSDTKLSKQLKLSKDAVRYRIKKLQEKGYIQYFITIVNTMKLGYDWYRTFIKFRNTDINKEKEIIESLKKNASWITKVEGKWDINTGIFCKTTYEYRDLINRFMLKYGTFIDKTELGIVTRMWIYNKSYLTQNKYKTPPLLMGFNEGEYEIKSIDEIDYKILKVILKNARMKTVDIARKTNTTEMIVRYRLKRLKEKGIILGFRPFFDIKKIGFDYFKLHVSLQNLEKKKSIILNYLHQHQKTVYTTELIGGDDIEVEFQVRDNQEFYNEIKKLRELFPDNIRDYEFMQYTKEYKFTYLP